MMVPAHVLSGMVCLHLGQMVAKRKDGRTRWSNLPEWTWLALGLIFAFLSHAVVDTLTIIYLPRWQSVGIVIFSHCFLGLDAGWCHHYHLGLVDKRSLWLRHTDSLNLRSLGPLPSPLHRWCFGRISAGFMSRYPIASNHSNCTSWNGCYWTISSLASNGIMRIRGSWRFSSLGG